MVYVEWILERRMFYRTPCTTAAHLKPPNHETPEKSQNTAIFNLHVGSHNTTEFLCSLHNVRLTLPCQDPSAWAGS